MTFNGLTVYRGQSYTFGGGIQWEIYEFAKGNLKNPSPTNELAIIFIKKPSNIVTLTHYPSDGSKIEVYNNLALKDINEAIDYLKSKKFE